jgi:hypothetical protein
MPAKRLPWIKFWPELLEHRKFGELSDAESWTWVVVWGKASQQPDRWKFGSIDHAARATGRPKKHIQRLIAMHLLDADPDGQVYIHDVKQWQDRFPSEEPTNGAASTDEDCLEDSLNTPATLHEHSPEDSSKTPVPPLLQKGEGRRENAPNGAAHSPIPKPNRSAEVIDAIRALGQEPTMTARDHAAVKASAVKPELIAEVYCAVFRGDYGDPFMQRHLCVREAIGWIDGYRSWKSGATPRPGKSAQSEHRVIDRTGVEN